jgi:membrane protein
LAITLTVSLSILIITALVLVLYGGRLGQELSERFFLGGTFLTIWKTLQWPTVLAFMLLAFALIYYLAPDVRDQKLEWITPGSVMGLAIWLLVSLGFRVYLHFFNSYSKTYGSLGAVIILMLWLYLTGTAILFGGEANAVIEDASAKQGASGAKEKGETVAAEA